MSKRSIGLLAVAGLSWRLRSGSPLPCRDRDRRRGGAHRGRKPNLNGIWQSFTTANWNIEAHSAEAGPRPEIAGPGAQPGGMSIIVDGDGTIPYSPRRWPSATRTSRTG